VRTFNDALRAMVGTTYPECYWSCFAAKADIAHSGFSFLGHHRG